MLESGLNAHALQSVPRGPMDLVADIGLGTSHRPFADDGVLIAGSDVPRSIAVLLATCEQRLLTHLEAVCQWPEERRNLAWRVGDFSYYILGFRLESGAEVYAQLWSEPGESGVLCEVCSGDFNADVARYLDGERRAMLESRGFSREHRSSPCNYRKVIGDPLMPVVAREALALLTEVLGVDRCRWRPRIADGDPAGAGRLARLHPCLVQAVAESERARSTNVRRIHESTRQSRV